MRNIKFLKEPGFTYDILFLFILYFNREVALEKLLNIEKADDRNAFFDSMLAPYLPISEDLRIFFYLNEHNVSFMTEKYFDVFKDDFFAGEFGFHTIISSLSDYDQVVGKILTYYFRDLTDEERIKCKESLPLVSRYIKEANFPVEIKNDLYAFFIDPIPFVQKLICELLEKERLVEQKYQKEYARIHGLQEEFDYDEFSTDLVEMNKWQYDISKYEDIAITFCLCHNKVIYFCMRKEYFFLMLGTDYKQTIQESIMYNKMPELDDFGNAVSEKNRVEILNLMVENGEVTIRDIENELGLTGTNAYYHLLLLGKAHLIKSRNKGRTLLYSIDKEYFEKLSRMMEKYSK